jgi:hypothetical protein
MQLHICVAEELFMSAIVQPAWSSLNIQVGFFFFVESLETHRPILYSVDSEIFTQWRNTRARNLATARRFGALCDDGISVYAQWCDARAVALCQHLKSESIWVVYVPGSSQMFIWSPENFLFSFCFLYLFLQERHVTHGYRVNMALLCWCLVVIQNHHHLRRQRRDNTVLMTARVWAWWLRYHGSIPRGGKIFSLSVVSRPGLEPTQSPIQWVPRVPSPGIKRLGCEISFFLKCRC